MTRNISMLIISLLIGILPVCASEIDSDIMSEFSMGVSLYQTGNYKKAIKHFELSVEPDDFSERQLMQKEYMNLWIASCYYHIGKDKKAKEQSIYYKATPIDCRQTRDIDSLYSIAAQKFDKKEYSEALFYYRKCIGQITSKLKYIHIFYSGLIEECAMSCEFLHLWDEVIKWRTEIVHIKQEYFGSNSIEYAEALENLATKESFAGKYDKAIKHTSQAILILEKLHQTDKKLHILCKMSNYQSFLGHYSEACNTIQNVIEECKKTNSSNEALLIMALNNYADYLLKLGEFSKGIDICNEALCICEGNSNSAADSATTLNVKANIEQARGNYTEAIKLDEQALGIRRSLFGDTHPECALIKNNLARYYMGIGQYQYCIDLQNQVLNIYETYYGRKEENYATGLNNLADYYDKSGKPEQSLTIEKQALHLWEGMYGKEHPDYAMALTIIANYYCKTGNIKQAISSINEALAIKENLFGKINPDYAISLNNLAYYSSLSGNYQQAIDSELEVLEILKLSVGESNPDYCMGLMLLADFYESANNISEEIYCLQKALELYKSSVGENNSSYAYCLSKLANVYTKQNNIDCAENFAESATKKYKEIVLDNFRFLTSHERKQLWGLYEPWYNDVLPTIAHQLKTDKIMATLYDSELLRKGLLLNAEMALRDLLEQSDDTTMLKTFDELSELKTKFQKQQEQNILSNAQADSINSAIKEIEKVLIDGSKTYGDYTGNLSLNWLDVKHSLKGNEISIEFIRSSDTDDTILYSALILDSNHEYPRYITLVSEEQLKQINKNNRYSRDWEENLYSKLVLPIVRAYPTAEVLYFSPVGDIHNIPIENLHPTFANQNVKLIRLSSTRQLVKRKVEKEKHNAVLFGGVSYDSETTGCKTSVSEMEIRGYEDTELITDTLVIRASGYKYLPGTEIEVRGIAQILSQENICTSLYTHEDANEQRFKFMSGQQVNILHVATHGFYWNDKYARQKKTSNVLLPILMNTNTEDVSLSRSGLILAGANRVLRDKKKPIGQEDGILTAREIANMDLHKVDIVVLSACQTGLGEISDEGVFGLQRGFKKAGVHSVVMTLWSVSDDATRFLMEEFYKNLIKGESQQTALSNAQKYIRETYSNYSSPYYWAAFVILDPV